MDERLDSSGKVTAIYDQAASARESERGRRLTELLVKSWRRQLLEREQEAD